MIHIWDALTMARKCTVTPLVHESDTVAFGDLLPPVAALQTPSLEHARSCLCLSSSFGERRIDLFLSHRSLSVVPV
jgi:hypothetical protein